MMADLRHRVADALEHQDGGHWVIDPTADDYLELADEAIADSLDAAWAEAEAALPEGWRLESIARDSTADDWKVVAWDGASGPNYLAERVHGPTPAAALRALAAKLRETGG